MYNSNVLLLQRFFYWGLELDACVNFYTCMGSCRRSIIVFLYISDVYFCFGYLSHCSSYSTFFVQFYISLIIFVVVVVVHNSFINILIITITIQQKKEKGGIGFDDYGGELELYDWNITHNSDASSSSSLPERTLLGSIKTATRFGALAWSKGLLHGGGGGGGLNSSILAGGMLDGTVNLW